MSADVTVQRLRASGAVGIVRSRSTEEALAQGRAALRAGLDVLEVSLVTPRALDVVATLVGEFPRAVVGTGTVLDAAQARASIAAGARVLVCPITSRPVIDAALEHDIAVLPGCLTPTEMLAAVGYGASAVKIFPAQLWTPEALTGLLQALPGLPCVPTGGVGPAQAATWIAAGALAVGVGSSLTAAADPARAVSDLRSAITRARVEHA